MERSVTMNDYFHESMVAKMVSSNEYQQGYSVGFSSGYNQALDECIKMLESEKWNYKIIARLEALKQKGNEE